MKGKVNCVMLIDDNIHDNFFHERALKKADVADKIIIKESTESALSFLKDTQDATYILPDIILLDINMPIMNGWDFLEKYEELEQSLRSKVIYLLSSSENPLDQERAKDSPLISGILPKPLTKEIVLREIGEIDF